jgi:hypothetical protein
MWQHIELFLYDSIMDFMLLWKFWCGDVWFVLKSCSCKRDKPFLSSSEALVWKTFLKYSNENLREVSCICYCSLQVCLLMHTTGFTVPWSFIKQEVFCPSLYQHPYWQCVYFPFHETIFLRKLSCNGSTSFCHLQRLFMKGL